MLDEMNQKDKKYMPFLNGHGQEEWQTENLEKSSVENQEKVLQRILEGKYSRVSNVVADHGSDFIG